MLSWIALKKGFTSLTALQKAMRDAAKADVIKEAADKVSNVGQSDEVNDTGWVEVPKGTYSLGNTRTQSLMQSLHIATITRLTLRQSLLTYSQKQR